MSVERDSETPLRDRPKNEYYGSIFNKYDQDNDGFINVRELDDLIRSPEFEHDIPIHVICQIHKMADQNDDKLIDFCEFIDMIHNPKLRHYFKHYINIYIKSIIPQRRKSNVAEENALYDERYSCRPPAVGMILISLIEIIFFSVDEAIEADSTETLTGPMSKIFVYDPDRRIEIWRFITYMFVHMGASHLVVNLLIQILLGTPLEMVHRWWRVLIIYFSGVVAGSLATSIADPTVRLAGASGGVYSLLTAHIATIIMNWKQKAFSLVQFLIFILIVSCDLGTAVHNRFVLNLDRNIGYVAHFAGAASGLLIGLNILINFEVTRAEKVIWWVSFATYFLLMGIAVVWNLAWPEYFPQTNVTSLG